jgi:hypothetical protein
VQHERQFKTLPEISTNSPKADEGNCSLELASKYAGTLLGSYRKGDANDADTYVGRVELPSVTQFLPSIKEINDACRDRLQFLWRIAEPPLQRRAVTRFYDTTTPGRRANLFVHADAPQYAAALEWTKTADAADWKVDPIGRPGIWVNPAVAAEVVRVRTKF